MFDSVEILYFNRVLKNILRENVKFVNKLKKKGIWKFLVVN